MLHLEAEADCSILTIALKMKWWRNSERAYPTLTSAQLIRVDPELALIFLTKAPAVPPVHQVAGKNTF